MYQALFESMLFKMVCLLFSVHFFYLSSLLLLLRLFYFVFTIKYIEMQKAMKNLEASHAWLSHMCEEKKLDRKKLFILFHRSFWWFQCGGVCVCVCIFGRFYFNANSVRPMAFFYYRPTQLQFWLIAVAVLPLTVHCMCILSTNRKCHHSHPLFI